MKWLLAVAALAGGAVGGWCAHSPSAAPAAPQPVAIAPGAEPVTLDQVRMLLAQHALAAPAPTAAAAAAVTAPVVAPPEPRPEPERHPNAVAAVKAASDDGVWSAEDRVLLRQQLTTMSEEEVSSTLLSLSVAINEGRLKPEAPLF